MAQEWVTSELWAGAVIKMARLIFSRFKFYSLGFPRRGPMASRSRDLRRLSSGDGRPAPRSQPSLTERIRISMCAKVLAASPVTVTVARRWALESMDRKGYIGKPDACAGCRSRAGAASDANFMRRYNPLLRVDQVC